MTDDLITFKTAKLAAEKGLRTLFRMGFITKYYHPKTESMLALGRTGRCKIEDLYYAPSQSLLQKWLRERHDIHLDVVYAGKQNTEKLPEYSVTSNRLTVIAYDEYEKALEKGLFKALELIK